MRDAAACCVGQDVQLGGRRVGGGEAQCGSSVWEKDAESWRKLGTLRIVMCIMGASAVIGAVMHPRRRVDSWIMASRDHIVDACGRR
jgi:hypothetical protein